MIAASILIAIALASVAVFAYLEMRPQGASSLLRAQLQREGSVPGLADLLVYDQLIAPDVIATKDDAYIAAWRISAPDTGSLDEQSIVNISQRVASAISVLPTNGVLQLYERRVRTHEYDTPQRYPNPLFRWLDERRRDVFTSQELFHSERILSFTWKLPTASRDRLRSAFQSGSSAADATEQELLAEFSALCKTLESQFGSALQIERLGERTEYQKDGVERLRSDLLEFVAYTISGKDAPFNAPLPGTQLSPFLAVEFVGGYQPRIGEDEIACVCLNGYPESTVPLMLRKLTELKVRHLFSIRMIPLETGAARNLFRDRLYEWAANANFNQTFVDPDAASMAEDSRQALGKASRGMLRFGMTTITLVLRDADRDRVDRAAREVISLLQDAGFRAFVPRMAAFDTWLGVPPGMGYFDQRRVPLHALNVAHLFPLHEESLGPRHSESPTFPCKVPAAAYALTPGNGLYRMHLNAGTLDTFHGLGIGGTGRGKSTMLNLLASSWSGRLPAAGFSAIDRGRSLYRLTKWVGGNFYDLLGANSPGFALFSRIEEESQSRACLEILEEMCELQGLAITPPRRESLERGLAMMAVLEPRLRSLTTYVKQIQDPEGVLRPALKLYTSDGALGNLLDSTTDTWDTSLWNVIDIANVIGLKERYLIPILRVVFWKLIENAREIRKTSGNEKLHWMYHIDEAHSLLRHPLGQRFILELLKMGRKELSGIFLWSNSVSDFAKCDIREDLLKACATRIWFGDPGATSDNPDLIKLYKDMELPERGMSMLAEMKKWSFLFHQPEIREMRELRLDLSPIELAIIGRSRPGDNQRVDRLIAENPVSWRERLLKEEGLKLNDDILQPLIGAFEAPI